MLNCLERKNLKPGLLWIVFLMTFLVSAHANGIEPNPKKGLLRSRTVTIVGKTRDSLIVNERHFRLTSSSTLWGLDNKKIQIYNLPIPCEAEVRYLLQMDQDPQILEVRITNILPGASTSWGLKMNE